MGRNLIIFLILATGCTFTQKVKTGEMAYELKYYDTAIKMLTDEYEFSRDRQVRARKAYLIAQANRINDELNQALKWYRTAYELDYGDQALFEYGKIMKRLERYDSAIKIFQALQNQGGANAEYRREIESCRRALEWKEGTWKYEVEILPINSPFSDYAPAIYEDGKIIFSSDRASSQGDVFYKWTGRKFSDIYVANPFSNRPEPFARDINSDWNEGTVCFNRTYDRIYFTRCSGDDSQDGFCKIYTSRRNRYGGWDKPTILSFVVEGYNYMHPTIATNDSILIFSSDGPTTNGGFDLFFVAMNAEGWGEPVSLGTRINTGGNERFPFLFKDTLYYASDMVGGMGGLDVYQSYVMDDGSWAPPQNLKPPINSGYDDFGFIIDNRNELNPNEKLRGYFASSRHGIGKDDIYLFRLVKSEADTVVPTVVEVEEEPDENFEIFLAITVVENIRENPEDPNSRIVGKNPISGVTVKINDQIVQTDAKGLILNQIKFDTSYRAIARKEDYLAASIQFRSPKIDKRRHQVTINKEIALDKIFVGKEIVLENIYYDFDQWFIRKDAEPTLLILAQLLKDNPNIHIQLSSHTDCRGNDDFNQVLSQKRAQAAVDFLVTNGIDQTRLSARGYGETQLIEKCECNDCSEEEHQTNRRTAFTIVE